MIIIYQINSLADYADKPQNHINYNLSFSAK